MAYFGDEYNSDYYGLTPAQKRARQNQAGQSDFISAQNDTAPQTVLDYRTGDGAETTPPDPIPQYQESTTPGQTPWAPGSDHPSSSPPGMHWDPTMANFVPDSPVDPTGGVKTPVVKPNPVAAPVPLPQAGKQDPLPQNAFDWQAWMQAFNSQPKFTAPQLPTEKLPLYQPQQVLTPDSMSAEAQQFALLQRVLAAPDQYTEENVRQLQEAQKEQALAAQKGAQQKLTDRYAALGRTGSGQLDANTRRMQDQTLSQILQGNRDINSQTTAANFNSKLNALQNANSVLNESAGRHQLQAGQTQLGFQSQQDQTKFALEQALAQAGLGSQANAQNLQQQQIALQGALGAGGLSLDQYKTDLGNNLGWYNALSSNDNFLKNLLAQYAFFNTNQVNNNNNGLK